MVLSMVAASETIVCRGRWRRRKQAISRRYNYCCCCLARGHVWVAFVVDKLSVVRVMVLGGWVVAIGGEKGLLT